jgi:hypothetical protein
MSQGRSLSLTLRSHHPTVVGKQAVIQQRPWMYPKDKGRDEPTAHAYRPRPAKRIRLLSGSQTMNVRAPHGSVLST